MAGSLKNRYPEVEFLYFENLALWVFDEPGERDFHHGILEWLHGNKVDG